MHQRRLSQRRESQIDGQSCASVIQARWARETRWPSAGTIARLIAVNVSEVLSLSHLLVIRSKSFVAIVLPHPETQ